ncbi:class I SAM-dependent methyltransferase [Algoriphagus aestuarii]|nr:class I SAM-dependent methyltransferase [Algoriphagus aestuarii]
MSQKLFPLIAFFVHWIRREEGYSLQSPFVFKLYQRLKNHLQNQSDSVLEIETFRRNLLESNLTIEVFDLGAGSKKVNHRFRKVSDITKHSTSSKKFALLYQYFCLQTPASTVLELGTCMGITTRYLSKATKGKVYTFEGSESIQQIAKPESGYSNIEFILGDIRKELPQLLAKIPKVDFALIDATHTYPDTIHYFKLMLEKASPSSIIAVGDIYWSKEMNHAWQEIKSHPAVRLSFDFYECGILFFDGPVAKENYLLEI